MSRHVSWNNLATLFRTQNPSGIACIYLEKARSHLGRWAIVFQKIVIARERSDRGNLTLDGFIQPEIATSAFGLLAMTRSEGESRPNTLGDRCDSLRSPHPTDAAKKIGIQPPASHKCQ